MIGAIAELSMEILARFSANSLDSLIAVSTCELVES